MPNSMTGFGQASVTDDELSAEVTVRTVNGKHLKTKVFLSINLPAVVERISELTAKHIRRGTVEVSVRLDWAGAGGLVFNDRVIASYVRQLERLRRRLGLSEEIRADRVALLPGATASAGLSGRAAGRVWSKLRPVVAEALEKVNRMRASEGRMLAVQLRRGGARIRRLLRRIEARRSKALDAYRTRLADRLTTLFERAGIEPDPGSLTREVILYSERSDISEELCRMDAHTEHFLGALDEPGSGRKLEFIAQEMHREANTMASKAADPVMSKWIIDLRSEVDQIREQVLNLE